MAKEGWDDHDRSSKFTARDMAADYLESCAPNAILFTYGDNDTYPLWYVQEVENIRPDVRVVNLSLLGTDWYIRQMKQKVNEAEGLPISMADEKFVRGVRDVMGYQDYQIPGSAELKDLFSILTSDNEADKVTYQDGSKENFLPTKKFRLTIDPDQVIATQTLPEDSRERITPAMEWTYNKNYITKTELAMIDILTHNNWERPIYFAITVPTDNFIGLDNYLYNEGFAYRLLPLEPVPADSADDRRTELTNTAVMYNNMMTKFKWGNIKNASYLDPESLRMCFTLINHFNILAENLYKEGRVEEARKALLKCLEVVPDRNYSLNFTIRKYYMADMLYKVEEPAKANELILNTTDYIEDQINYLTAIAENKENLNARDVQLGMYVIGEMVKLAEDNGQADLHKKLDARFKALDSRFMGLLR
jgi:tetratricopeptide (TPR) repeat protein